MERLSTRLLVLAVLCLLVASWLRQAAAHYIEDRYDIPGVHDCWGFRPHRWECKR
jgi:hypothetical protein